MSKKSMRYPLICLVLMFFLCGAGKSQIQNDDYLRLAGAGYKSITKGEFEKRFEFSPNLRLNKNTLKEKQLEALYTYLTEKLWAIDAEAKGLDTLPSMQITSHALMNMFVRDLMYMREVRDKVEYTNDQFLEAVNRQRRTLDVKYLFSEDSTEIFNLYTLLNEGVEFDTLLGSSWEAKIQEAPETVKYGQMADDIEDSLYSLSMGQFTAPIQTPIGWYIFKLCNYTEDLMVNPNNPEDKTVKFAVYALKAKLEQKRYAEFYRKFFGDKKININNQLLRSLAVHMAGMLSDSKNTYHIKNEEAISLTVESIAALQLSIPRDTMQMVIADIQNTSYTLEKFLLLMFFEGYRTTDVTLQGVYKSLQQTVRRFIEGELLAVEGKKMGLDQDAKVKSDFNMWKDHYLYQLNRYNFFDSLKVTDEEALEFYQKENKELHYPVQLNIIEILTDSLEIVDKVLSKVRDSVDFRILAKQFNKRQWTQKTGGEYGYFPYFSNGEIGQIASKMEVGEVFGPIKLPEGYSIIKLIGKRAEYIEYPKMTFEELKETIKLQLKTRKYNLLADRHSLELANKYKIDVVANVFKRLETTSIPSYAVRRLGFGGQLSAAPMIAPDNNWVEKYLEQFNKNP